MWKKRIAIACALVFGIVASAYIFLHYFYLKHQMVDLLKKGQTFKDPGSIQLRNVKFKENGGLYELCGEVNAKNAMGGYVGFNNFYMLMTYGAKEPSIIIDQSSETIHLAKSLCDKK